MISYHARGVAEPVSPSPDTATAVAPSDNATPGSAPAQDAPARQRPGWSGRCPFCRSVDFNWGTLACACGATLAPTRGAPPTHATGSCHPRWEDDHQLGDGDWNRYSRRGRLAGRLDQLDEQLDLDAGENLDRIQAIAETLRAIRVDLKAHGEVGLRPRRRRHEVLEPAAVMGMRETWVTLLCWAAIELDNARLRRGGRGDEITRPRAQRVEPFAGYRHAIASAFGGCGVGAALGAGGPPLPAAPATHRLPRGVQFGTIAVAPSHGGAARARGEDAVIARLDLEAALLAARVDGRTYSEGGKVRRDAGRLLSSDELELTRLVDCGEVYAKAKTATKDAVVTILRDAVEPVHPRDAAKLVQQGVGEAGAPMTERQARLSLKTTRRAIAHVLEDRGLIPAPRPLAPSRTRAPSSDPFAGVGSGA